MRVIWSKPRIFVYSYFLMLIRDEVWTTLSYSLFEIIRNHSRSFRITQYHSKSFGGGTRTWSDFSEFGLRLHFESTSGPCFSFPAIDRHKILASEGSSPSEPSFSYEKKRLKVMINWPHLPHRIIFCHPLHNQTPSTSATNN